MTAWNFYRQCLCHASRTAWLIIGVISTATTYIPAIAAKIFGVLNLDISAALLMALPLAIILCFVLIPFREAFKLLKEKDGELQTTKDKLQKSLDLLQREKDQLIEQLQDKRDRLKLKLKLNDLIAAGNTLENNLKTYMDSNKDSPGTEFEKLVADWLQEVCAFLKSHLPEYVAHFNSDAGLEVSFFYMGNRQMSDRIQFMGRRINRLNELLLKILA